MSQKLVRNFKKLGRTLESAKHGDKDLGHFQLLPGTWSNLPDLPGRGWNMIALPYRSSNKNLNYRLLVNQYNEILKFTTVDKGVPNRGIEKKPTKTINLDQFVVALDYEQHITQIAAEDVPNSGKAGGAPLDIHHEPGLFLQMLNFVTKDFEVARLGSIPHGNAVFALGKVKQYDGPPKIDDENGLPIGVKRNLKNPYLEPYKHYHENPFIGVFDPTVPNELLKLANQGVKIKRTTEFEFNTRFGTGGINNIPFIERHADASNMHCKFYIQELPGKNAKGKPNLRLQYTQTVMLDFFPRKDGKKGLIEWPHTSINTLVKID